MPLIPKHVQDELDRQVELWGVFHHTPCEWLVILTKQLGQVAKAILADDRADYKRQVIHVTAVALAWYGDL